jgi:hypothetical protein
MGDPIAADNGGILEHDAATMVAIGLEGSWRYLRGRTSLSGPCRSRTPVVAPPASV